MKVAVFTSNQPRHQALLKRLAERTDEVLAIQECNTVFPGRVPDFFSKSDVMRIYFSNVMAAEHKVFGNLEFLPANVRTLSIRTGDLSMLDPTTITEALNCSYVVVFGASYI